MEKIAPLFVCAFFCLPLFFGLDLRDLGNDEAIYAYAVDTILIDGDWLTPKGIYPGHAPFFEKPPLLFWLSALPMQLDFLSQDEFGYRFWPVVFGGISFLYLYAIGRRIGGMVCGITAVLIFFTRKELLFTHGLRSYVMESPLVLAYIAGVFHFLCWMDGKTNRTRIFHLSALGIAFCLGFMTKFAAALFLPLVLVISIICVDRWRSRLLEDAGKVLLILILLTSLITPWFLTQHAEYGANFWNILIGEHIVQRMTAHLDPTHLQPASYYVTWLINSLQRGSVLLFVLLGFCLFAAQIRAANSPEAILLTVWMVVPLVLVSAMTSKLAHYFYPFLAPCALAGGFAVAWLTGNIKSTKVTLPEGFERFLAREISRTLRVGIVILATLTLVLSCITLLLGGFEWQFGDNILGKSSSVVKPLVFGVCLLVVAFTGRVRWLVLLLILTPAISRYGWTIEKTNDSKQSLSVLQACLSEHGAKPVIRNLLPEGMQFTHPTSFYQLSGVPMVAGDTQLNDVPVWTEERNHHLYPLNGTTYRVAGAYLVETQQLALLTLPTEFSECGTRLEAAGSQKIESPPG